MEFVLNAGVGDVHLAADARQLGRGVVAHVPTLIQATVDLGDDRPTRADPNAGGHVSQARELALQPVQRAVERARGDESIAHVEQVGGRQHPSVFGILRQRADVVRATERSFGLDLEKSAGLARRLQSPAYFLQAGRRCERQS